MTEQEPQEQAAETETPEAPKAGSSVPGADDFRDALSNLSSALDRFGKAAEARARQEWEQGRPEINRAVDEVKRGLEGLIRKSGEVFDSATKRLAKDEGATPPPATPAEPEAPADETAAQ